MGIKSVDAGMLKAAVLASAKRLESKKEWINELNVFPVPDGDTGTNMTMTIMAAAKEVAEPAPRYAEPSVELILQMSPVVASRVYRAYKRGEYIPLSEIEPVAINSIGGRDGLFEYKRFVNPFGQPLEAELYGLSAKWMAFLKDPAKLDQLRAISGGWLSQEE